MNENFPLFTDILARIQDALGDECYDEQTLVRIVNAIWPSMEALIDIIDKDLSSPAIHLSWRRQRNLELS